MTFLSLRIVGAQVVPVTGDFSGCVSLDCPDSGFVVLPLRDGLTGMVEHGSPEQLRRGDLLVFSGKYKGWLCGPDTSERVEDFARFADRVRANNAASGQLRAVVLRIQLCEIVKGGFGDSLPGHLLLVPPEDRRSYIISIAEHLAGIADDGADREKAKVVRFTELLLIEVLDMFLNLDTTTSRLLRNSRNLRIGDAVKAVHQNPEYDWTVSRLASIASMSRSLFACRFKETYGETPLNYVRQCRIHRAKILLTESLAPLDHIAEQCGYASQSAFIKVFSAACGHSPGRWRSMQKTTA